MIQLIFKANYQGVHYTCYCYVHSLILRSDHRLLVCSKQSTISDTVIISEYLQCNFLSDKVVIILKPRVYSLIVQNLLGVGCFFFGQTSISYLGGFF